MTRPPILKLPDFSKTSVIECDTSGKGIGAIFMQSGQLIAYMSKVLKGKVLLLSTYENELLALVIVVQRWRPYLLGKSFTVKTNQQALQS